MNAKCFGWFVLTSFLVFLGGCKTRSSVEPVTSSQTSVRLTIGNGIVRLEVEKKSNGLVETYFAKSGNGWQEVARTLDVTHPSDTTSAPLYARGNEFAMPFRLIANDSFHSVTVVTNAPSEITVQLTGYSYGNRIRQTVSLRKGEDHFHVDINASLREPEIEYLLSSYNFVIPGTPDFEFTPTVKRASDDLVGDRKFFAPATIIAKNGYLLALVPDLDLINSNIVYAQGARPQKHPRIFAVPMDTDRVSLPTAMDLAVHPGVSTMPLLSYGFIDYWTEQHMYWRHENADGRQIRHLSSGSLHYGFDLFVSNIPAKKRGFQEIASFLWAKYGSRYFRMPKPQVMPFAQYARICYPASFSYEGYSVNYKKGQPLIDNREGQPGLSTWQQWDSGNVAMGGLRLSAPQWFQFIYNTSWWNNAGDATGIYFWGKRLHDSSLLDKARRIINFTLSSPQQEGIFPALYDVDRKRWVAGMWKPPEANYNPDSTATYFNWKDGVYQTSSASTTAAFLLQYDRNCEHVTQIVPFVKRYADFLIKNISADGCIPAFFSKDLRASPCLAWNAEGGLHMWLLSDLYKMTGGKQYLRAATKLAGFLEKNILPHEKWYDFETFYSCAVKPETFYDKYTGQYPANTMSVDWAIEGFNSLFEATKDPHYLALSEQVADYSIFYQAVWAPPYIITAYPFGGFSSQNSDAEWLDQRSHLFAHALIKTGLLSSRQDLVERGVAAARASLTLTNEPEAVENHVYPYPNFPLGLGPENIDHEGFPQMPLRSGPSWCEVGGLQAVASVLRLLGGAYIDFDHNISIGTDGVTIRESRLSGDTLSLGITSLLSPLAYPWPHPFDIDMRISGLKKEKYELILNGRPVGVMSRNELDTLSLAVNPDGRIMAGESRN